MAWSAHPPDHVKNLLTATLRRYIHSEAQLQEIREMPIAATGASGAIVKRYQVGYTSPQGNKSISFVVKETNLVERRTLALLNSQKQPAVPYSSTMDLTSDTTASLCLQDLGNTLHPQILAPIETPFLRQEASGLAQIHHANGAEEGVWLPRLDREYIALQLHYRFWRPWWKALKNQDFVHTFKPYLMLLETAAQQIEEEMEVLYQDKEAWTLIHADIHPGNVLIWQDSPFFIDWATAHRGPFYLDLPRHFFPLERAEIYRQERERLGDHFSHADFCERYRIAARYIGLRKTWEYLQAFYTSRDTTLAYYYIQMVLHS